MRKGEEVGIVNPLCRVALNRVKWGHIKCNVNNTVVVNGYMAASVTWNIPWYTVAILKRH